MSTKQLSTFTVVGIYQDTQQRFCSFIKAESAAHAEVVISQTHPTLNIAGVFAGILTALDIDPVA